MLLTKSDLTALRQCTRMLWLNHHRPDLYPPRSASLDRRVIDGNIVGEFARRDVGDFVWPGSTGDKADDAREAVAIIRSAGARAAVEVPMVRDDLYARADAVLSAREGYVLRETKASSFPRRSDRLTPDRPEEHYLDDVAVQTWVMDASGLARSRVELNYLDGQWRYPGGGDYHGLFRQLDVTVEAQLRAAAVPLWLSQGRDVLAGAMPDVRTGPQCKSPYECPYRGFCSGIEPPGPPHPVTLLPNKAGKDLARRLLGKGYASLLDVPPGELVGKQAALYRRIQRAHLLGEAVIEDGARPFMRALPYPRYYFDFEGIDLPVPRWPGVRPYEQIPFQWSCHVESSPGGFEHRAFLDLTGDDPSIPCIRAMLECIDPTDEGPILVYHKPYEDGRLRGLAERHPAFAVVLETYRQRLVDLLPIVRANFYHPAMKGSFSIKQVLPVVAPHLRYAELEEVQEGTGAQVAYLIACFDESTSNVRKRELRARLLDYCELDTWAMVEIAWFLEGRSGVSGLRPHGVSP